MEFKKGDLVEVNDNGLIRKAVVVEDGIDRKNRVRVRAEGIPLNLSITIEPNDRAYIITN